MADDEKPDEKRPGPDREPSRPLTGQDLLIAAFNKKQEELKDRADRIIAVHGTKLDGMVKDIYLIDDEATRKVVIEEVAQKMAARRVDLPQVSGEDLSRLIKASLYVQYSSDKITTQDSRKDDSDRAPSQLQADTTANVERDEQITTKSNQKPDDTKITEPEEPTPDQSLKSKIPAQAEKGSDKNPDSNAGPEIENADLGPTHRPQPKPSDDDLRLAVSKSGKARAELNDAGSLGEMTEAQRARLDGMLDNMWRDTANEVTQHQGNNPTRGGRGFPGS